MKTSQYIFRYETFCDGLGAYKEVGCNARELTAVTDYKQLEQMVVVSGHFL